MSIKKTTIDKGLTVLAALSAPVLSILIRHHVVSAADATDIGGGVALVVGAYHGGALVQKRKSEPTVSDTV